jgi:hypothetical protein
MPFQVGSVSVHDDGQHTGSAKRDTASGVAGLDSDGDVIAPGKSIELTRDVSDYITIRERTSNEGAFSLERVGVSDYAGYIRESAGNSLIQTASMKNVANGIAGLDANLLVPGQEPAEHYENNMITTGGLTNMEVQLKNGAAHDVTYDSINLEIDLTSGNAAVGYEGVRTKPTFALGTRPMVVNYWLKNIVNGTGNIVSIYGLSSDFTAQVPADAAGLRQSSDGTWHLWTRTGGAETLSANLNIVSGDRIQLILTSAKVELYVNAVLVATHTTNISANAMYIGFAQTTITAAPTVARTISVGYYSYTRY